MKFGDLVANKYASNNNPHKILMFIRKGHTYLMCLSNTGETVNFREDNCIIEKIGEVDFSIWKEKIRELKPA